MAKAFDVGLISYFLESAKGVESGIHETCNHLTRLSVAQSDTIELIFALVNYEVNHSSCSHISSHGRAPSLYIQLIPRFLSNSYPMPTIALINGHAFAGGFMTAMMHDYRFMNPHHGFLCLNELDFGATLQPPMTSIFRQKVPNPNTFRTMILESKRFAALEALKEGLVDGLGAAEDVLSFIEENKLVKRGHSGIYGILKEEMWGETVRYLDLMDGGAKTLKEREEARKALEQEQRKRLEEWEKQNGGKRYGPKL